MGRSLVAIALISCLTTGCGSAWAYQYRAWRRGAEEQLEKPPAVVWSKEPLPPTPVELTDEDRARLAAREARKAEVDRYIWDTVKLCLERYSGQDVYCYSEVFTTPANALYELEHGSRWDGTFDLDPEVGTTTADVAKTCREKTMDGGLVDGFNGMICVQLTVQELNRQARRERRLRLESGR